MDENRTELIGRKTAAMLDDDGRVPRNVIELRSGAFVDPFDLDPDLVFIEDIAGGLARISRFTGCSDTYGAEHAIIVEKILAFDGASALTQLHGLLHDAHEAYLGDLPKPIKCRPEYEFYRHACAITQDRIYDALRLPSPTSREHAIVECADLVSLFIEARRGLPSRGECWRVTTQALIDEANVFTGMIEPMHMDHVLMEETFLDTYAYLRKEACV